MAQVGIADPGTLFSKCAPSIRTNIGECGTVTLCANVKPETIGDLNDIYEKDGEFRLLSHLFLSHFQIKACGAVQHSMRDFFMANTQITQKGELSFDQNDRGLTKVAPFIMAEQKKPINNVYWRLSNIGNSGGNLTGRAYSGSGIPADTRSFPVGTMMFLVTLSAGGSKIDSQYTVTSATISNDGTYVALVLTPQMTGTMFPVTGSSVTSITADMSGKIGILRRGVINIGKTESYCEDEPAYRNDNLVPFWIQHTRWTSCQSELYNEWLALVLDNNPLYKARIYISETDRMKQKGEAFEKRLFDTLFFQQPISDKQNLYEYDQLPDLTNFISDTGLGVEGGRCYGKKANAVGWLSQLRECGRWYDAQGVALNIYSIFDAIYNMRRVRAGIGSTAQLRFDVFTDGITAENLDRAMIGYYGLVFGNKDRYNVNIAQGANEEYGIQFTSYKLRERNAGVTLNIITDWAFDDQVSEFTAAGIGGGGQSMWFLDLTGMYMKLIESNKVTNHTGDLKALAAVDNSYGCVEETYTRDTVLNGMTFTAVLECPAADLILDNFADAIPVFAENTRAPGNHPSYDGTDVQPYTV